ncbi:hypothetical protein ACFL5S_01070 [Fibrobacterota bacterium]
MTKPKKDHEKPLSTLLSIFKIDTCFKSPSNRLQGRVLPVAVDTNKTKCLPSKSAHFKATRYNFYVYNVTKVSPFYANKY